VTDEGITGLKEFKKQYPILQSIPDSEFKFINGNWCLSNNAVRLLAFQNKNKGFLKFINQVEGMIKK
jgi:hypothetical protein